MNCKTIWKNFVANQYHIWFKKEIDKGIEEINIEISALKEQIRDKDVEIVNLEKEIQKLKRLLKGDKEKVNCYGTMTSVDLRSLLRPHSNTVRLSDSIYGLTTSEEAKIYSETTKVAIKEYIKNSYDCDEFSFALMGYWNLDLYQFAFGIAWSKTHAFNIMVDNDKQIWVIEPQSNIFYKIEKVKDKSQYYPMDMILI